MDAIDPARERETPGTEAGRRLLYRESLNSRAFSVITAAAILAVEAEARQQGREEIVSQIQREMAGGWAISEVLPRLGVKFHRSTFPIGADD